DEAAEPTVAPDRFSPADRDWHQEPDDWSALPEDRMLSKETLTVIQMAIEALPPNQREVIRLRDLEGWSAEEVCNVLNISDTNQRVLLHRARAKVRRALEVYLQPE
ncbi:MAG: RNA polymerase sigma factor, partial [Anaerolineae bacterium]|nr:RNA polymerase sigma factor [Anaerolineae bacterium]